jgi:zinc transporter ZupT
VRLITAHRILIGAAIAFFLFYAAFQGRRAIGPGGASAGVQAVVSAMVAVALVAYYRSLRRWGRR